MSEKNQVAAIEGWFEDDGTETHLVGSRCGECGTYFFPSEGFACRNPACHATDLADVRLSRTGRLWSFTNNCYPPPAPYVSTDPFVPYIVAAVELDKEKMVVLGQVVPGVEISELSVGMEMEVVAGALFEDDEAEHMTWKWRPTGSGRDRGER